MPALAFVEIDGGKPKKSSLEAVSYAAAVEPDTAAIVFGVLSDPELALVGKAGARKVFQVSHEAYAQPNGMAYASAIAECMDSQGANLLVLAKSSMGDPVSARVSIKLDASLASNVVDVPDTSNGFAVKCSIYTGKAFASTILEKDKRVLVIKKNAVPIGENGTAPVVETFEPTQNPQDFAISILDTEKATSEISLPEAEIVVSGGRGLKGPENWGMIEDLAHALGAATGCSKPVSDMDWRPHHEHVGQTGIKVSPTLYVAIGISGAIQHLAGVNSSKYILVINKDPEAPFFKAADYGVVGDAFDVVPKLASAIKAAKG